MHARLLWDRSQVDGPRHDWRSRSDAQTGVAVDGPDTPAPDEDGEPPSCEQTPLTVNVIRRLGG
jgi:hypothetical protein